MGIINCCIKNKQGSLHNGLVITDHTHQTMLRLLYALESELISIKKNDDKHSAR